MKKESIFRLLICCFLGLSLFFTVSCASRPVEVPEEEPSLLEQVFRMLQRGDREARNFFIGEIDVNSTDWYGRTPLHYAAELGDAALASLFISLGARVNALDNDNQSPLGISISRNDPSVTAVLANANADIHLPILEGTTAAMLALERSIGVFNAILTPVSLESADSNGRTILHLASIYGNVQAVESILRSISQFHPLINRTDNERKNALDHALERGDSLNHMLIAEQLILRGSNSDNPIFLYFAPAVRTANFNIRRSEGFAPIHFAVRNNHVGLIRLLINKGININIQSFSGATPLHESARTGNMEVMRLLLDNGAGVNIADARGNTPLHIGIPVRVHREAALLLLSRGADPNLRNEIGDTPLHSAIKMGRHLEIIQTLLENGSDVHIRNMLGETPLYIAVQESRSDLISLLLSFGSEVFAFDNSGITPFDLALRENGVVFNELVTTETVNQRDNAGNTMLHVAVRNAALRQQVSLIIERGAVVDTRNMDGNTALHLAVRLNHRENGEYLISHGANIFTANVAGESPLFLVFNSPGGMREWFLNPTTISARDGLGNNMLHYAAQWNINFAIPVIINRGISVEEQNIAGETPLFMAVQTDSPSTIGVLLENRANLNARDNQGHTLLHTAVRWDAINAASFLISSGINLNIHSMSSNTALHDAVILGRSDIENLLIREGANLEVRDVDGNTPFMTAVSSGLASSVGRLAANGADVSTRNTRGDTPLHIAVANERFDLAALLLGTGASIHARNNRNITPFRLSLNTSPRMVTAILVGGRIHTQDDDGNTALHIAVQERASFDTIRAIIDSGARINAVDFNGNTPLRHAMDTHQIDVVRLLSDSGADPFIAGADIRSPADLAISRGEEYLRAMFSGRAIDARDSSYGTILHLAARTGSPRVIEVLLELGANRNIRNVSGETPLDIAQRWNRTNIAELLR